MVHIVFLPCRFDGILVQIFRGLQLMHWLCQSFQDAGGVRDVAAAAKIFRMRECMSSF